MSDGMLGVALALRHRLHVGLDKIDLLTRQTVFTVELLVDLRHGERPVDVGAGREILQRDETPLRARVILRDFYDTEHCTREFALNVFQASVGFVLGIKCADGDERVGMPD